MRHFYQFLESKLLSEVDGDYWKEKLRQLKLKHAAPGEIPHTIINRMPEPTDFVERPDGLYEKMTPQDEKMGLTFLSRWANPSGDGSYYAKSSRTGKFTIVRQPKHFEPRPHDFANSQPHKPTESKLVETDEDYWKQRMQQFQKASQGQTNVIHEPRKSGKHYIPPTLKAAAQQAKPKEFMKMSDGYYEKPTPEDEKNGLTTLSTWERPASDGCYYKQDKQTGRFVIVRPNQALGNFYNK